MKRLMISMVSETRCEETANTINPEWQSLLTAALRKLLGKRLASRIKMTTALVFDNLDGNCLDVTPVAVLRTNDKDAKLVSYCFSKNRPNTSPKLQLRKVNGIPILIGGVFEWGHLDIISDNDTVLIRPLSKLPDTETLMAKVFKLMRKHNIRNALIDLDTNQLFALATGDDAHSRLQAFAKAIER